MGDFESLQAYIEEILKRPVFTHELPSLEKEIKQASKPDFLDLCKPEKEQ